MPRIKTSDKFDTKDSGQRREYETGARRDVNSGKGRYDLISPIMMKRLAELMERGAVKYGAHNWEKGMPLSQYLDSAMRHLWQLIASQDDEDHAAAVIFNVMAFMHTQHKIWEGELPEELDDTFKG